MNQTNWVNIEDGLDVIKLWETTHGPKKPEIAILRLSDVMYETFHEDPQAFLEKHKVFPFTLRRVDHMHSAQEKAPGDGSDPVIVLNFHRPDCSVISLSQGNAS